jgi:putative endonuclease
MFFVYILQNSIDKIYIGQTNNLASRLSRHNDNQCKFTKNKGPWRIVFNESFKTRAEAMNREKFLKSGKGREWIKINVKLGSTSA